jgi:putative flippase GtrA
MAIRLNWAASAGAAPARESRTGLFSANGLASFVAVGVVCTLLFALAYDGLRTWLAPLAANCLALTTTAGLNFVANRWLTFRGRGGPLLRDAWQYALCYVVGLGASSLALAVILSAHASPSQHFEVSAALGTSGFATVVRYVSLSLWVFREQRTEVTSDGR